MSLCLRVCVCGETMRDSDGGRGRIKRTKQPLIAHCQRADDGRGYEDSTRRRASQIGWCGGGCQGGCCSIGENLQKMEKVTVSSRWAICSRTEPGVGVLVSVCRLEP